MRILPFVALIFSALLAACASEISNPLVGGIFADSGKYEFHSCEQIATNRKRVAARLERLKLLMDKAEKGTGGAVVSVIAYKGEYVEAQDELKVIDATARDKKCKIPENGAALPPSGEGDSFGFGRCDPFVSQSLPRLDC
jgi:hypothetical protein